MFIIPTILLILLLVCVLILLVPFHISLKIHKAGGLINGFFELHWFRLRLFKKEFPEKEEKKDKKVKKEKEKEKEIAKEKEEEKTEKEEKWNWEDIRKILKLVWDSLGPILHFLGDIWHSIEWEKLRMHIILGFNSPVDTAKTLGYIWAVVSLVNMYPQVYLSAEPSFNQERMDGEVLLKLRIRLIRPVIAILRLLTKKSVLKLIWEVRKLRKKSGD